MNCIYSLSYFSSEFNDILNNFSCLVFNWFYWLYAIEKTVNCIQTLIKNLCTFVLRYQKEALGCRYSQRPVNNSSGILKLQLWYKPCKGYCRG